MPDMAVRKYAEISNCGAFRYRLTRRWDSLAPLLPFIMLNPSDADSEIDDPTVRRCMGFARHFCFGGIEVGNLYAFRSPKPAIMRAAVDPIGPCNDAALRGIFATASYECVPVVAAWGAGCIDAAEVLRCVELAAKYSVMLTCLGKSKDGHPRHPLYVPIQQPLVSYP